ncbi:putative F-box protein PP2-B12 [Malania oleifera]|uniref:putative F-box protein PP2-B12 n=1 Tax=Malania oleifera TaxID=397392 RepID=UPI0025AEB09E|nr:putative F-box protein PP2-B12 [Malania oleifera]
MEGASVEWGRLPEGCIAEILSLTTPADACRLSLVCSVFRSAADSDAVWERFLPADYLSILSRSQPCSAPPAGPFSSKKDLYFHLCDFPILIDEGTKAFSLEKCSGKKCYMIASKNLYIVWGDTPKHWRWVSLSQLSHRLSSLPHSRFSEVAELLDVCWLEIQGKVDTSMLSPNTNYAAYLVFILTEPSYGFDRGPVEVFIEFAGRKTKARSVYLDPSLAMGSRRQNVVEQRRRRSGARSTAGEAKRSYLQVRGDGWQEVKLGEFYCDGGEGGQVEMSVVEVKEGHWKSGLIIQGVEIRPKEKRES